MSQFLRHLRFLSRLRKHLDHILPTGSHLFWSIPKHASLPITFVLAPHQLAINCNSVNDSFAGTEHLFVDAPTATYFLWTNPGITHLKSVARQIAVVLQPFECAVERDHIDDPATD